MEVGSMECFSGFYRIDCISLSMKLLWNGMESTCVGITTTIIAWLMQSWIVIKVIKIKSYLKYYQHILTKQVLIFSDFSFLNL